MGCVFSIPRLSANEDELTLSEVLVTPGQTVKSGQVLFVVESSKASSGVESSLDGVVRWVVDGGGGMLPVGAPVCAVTATASEPMPEGLMEAPASAAESTHGRTQTLTAKERLQQKKAAASAAPERQGAPAASSVERERLMPGARLPWVKEMVATLQRHCGTGATAAHALEGPISGPHAEPGVHIEEGAQVEAGARIVARRVFLGRGARLAAGCELRASSVYLGAEVRCGGGTRIHSGELWIEDGVVLAGDVAGDLSGGQTPDSRLIVGGASLIGSGVYLNTSSEILIERECAVSPRAMLFTHSYWQSVLDGYQPLFHAVRMCENSWVGAGCQVLPGVVVGSGAIALSNSTVVQDVAPETMVGGIPARVVRRGIRKPLPIEERLAILRRLLARFAEHVQYKGCRVAPASADRWTVERADVPARTIVLCVERADELPTGPSIHLCLRACELPARADDVIFDLEQRTVRGREDRVAHELRNYLRRQGIRFLPYAWDSDYRKGL